MELEISKFEDVKEIFLDEEDREYIDEVRNYGEKIFVVIKKMNTYKELRENNRKVLYKVAGHIQDKLQDKGYPENLIWNIYLIYIVKEKENNNPEQSRLIKEIENKKFCCKNYIISTANLEEINEEIEKRIPIFMNFESVELKPISNKKKVVKDIPLAIKTYLEKEGKSIDEFLKINFNKEFINLIYEGDKDEN